MLANKNVSIILPVVHIVSSLADPEHGAPPLQGAGLLHCLLLLFFPVLASQELQDPHKLHPPFTPWLPRSVKPFYMYKIGLAQARRFPSDIMLLNLGEASLFLPDP